MAASASIDLKKQWSALYAPSAKAPALITVPPLPRIAVTGAGDPNSAPAWAQAVEALYTLAYTLKFMRKTRGHTPDFGVMPLEALWWTPEMATFSTERKGDWQWTAFLVQAEAITEVEVEEARTAAQRKKGLPALERIVFERFEEGLCAQILHIGPYAAEAPTIRTLHAFIAAQGLELRGHHHEIYLSDPARTAPDRLKTIIRQPAARA